MKEQQFEKLKLEIFQCLDTLERKDIMNDYEVLSEVIKMFFENGGLKSEAMDALTACGRNEADDYRVEIIIEVATRIEYGHGKFKGMNL